MMVSPLTKLRLVEDEDLFVRNSVTDLFRSLRNDVSRFTNFHPLAYNESHSCCIL